MDLEDQNELAGTVGTDVTRRTLLREIIAKVDGFDAAGSDEELDRWWGLVEVDRLASGLTLATIARLADPDADDDPPGPWLLTSDEAGDAATQLSNEGRDALRRSGSA